MVEIKGNRFTRYCAECDKEGVEHLHRKSFDGEVNDPKKGWRQEAPEKYGIIRDEFPIVER